MSEFFVTLKCTKGCREWLRIARYHNPTARLPFIYCPYCGAEGALAFCDPDEDWWQAMCESYNLPKSILEPIYDLWRTDPESTQRFSDYMDKFRKNSDALYDEVMQHAV